VHGLHNLHVRAAAAQVVQQRLADLRVRGLRAAAQQGHGGHHHAIGAVAALGGLGVDEGLLHGVRCFAASQAFQRGDLASGHALRRNHAGPRHAAVHQHRAGAAFAQPAAELRAVAERVIAQHLQQGGPRLGMGSLERPAVEQQAHHIDR
jgi:hypothetical protein